MMTLTDKDITCLNVLARWLAEDDFSPDTAQQTDWVILAGHAVLPNIEGAFTYVASTSQQILLSGGIGHSTALLGKALASQPRYANISTAGASEAEILAEMAMGEFGIAQDRLLLDTQSRNCGENAAFSLRLLRDRAELPERIIVVQDPLMQRRTTETFRFTWAKQDLPCAFISWPVFTPSLQRTEKGLMIGGAASQDGLWDMDRYVAMILGEIRRLRDDASGYGPAGLGFIGHVTLPEDVTQAWDRLMANPALQAIAR